MDHGEGVMVIKKLLWFLLVMILSFTLVGCAAIGDNSVETVSQTNTSTSFNYPANLTLEEVTETIAEAGLELIEIPGAGQTLRLNEITPTVFSVNRTEETMLVYVCPSIALCKLITRTITPDYGFGRNYDEDYLSVINNCKNVLIINKIPLTGLNKPVWGAYDSDKWSRFAEAVLKLKDAQESLVYGSSAHWEGKLKVMQYSYWYQDIDGTNRLDSYSQRKLKIRYLGPPNEVEEIAYSIDYPGGAWRGTGHLDKDGCILLSHCKRDCFLSDDVYSITLEWNGNKESLCLKGN